MPKRSYPEFLAVALLGSLPLGSGVAQEPPAEKLSVRLIVQSGHTGVHSAVFSPDGKFILTGGTDQTARLWDVATGKELLTLETEGNVSVAYAPDGTRLLTGGSDGLARQWDAHTGKELHVFKGHTGNVHGVAYSPDGLRVLTGGADKTARLWDALTGKQLLIVKGLAASAVAIAYSADGQRLMTGAGKTVQVWDAHTGKELLTLKGHEGNVVSIAASLDGQRVLTGSLDKTVRLWDAESGKELLSLPAHDGPVRSLAFSPDGNYCITINGKARKVQIWDTLAGKEVRAFEHKDAIQSVAFSRDGRRVITAGIGGAARLWDARSGKELLLLRGRVSAVHAVAISPDGRRMAIGSQSTHLWDAESGIELRTLKSRSGVFSTAFTPDGKQILIGRYDGAQLWDYETGKEQFLLKSEQANIRKISSVACSTSGKHFLIGGFDWTVRLWDAKSSKDLHVFKAHQGPVHSVAFAPDGRRAVSAGGDRTARVWDIETGKELLVLKGNARAVSYSPDGKLILTGGVDGTAKLWNAETGKETRTFQGQSSTIDSVAFSSDGKQFLTAGRDKTIRLWDAESGKKLLVFSGHASRVNQAVFFPNSKHLLSASDDKTARLWDMETGKELCRLVSFDDGGWAVVDAAGRYDASNGGDVEGLHWVVEREPIALKQLKERYYDPGLLAKHMGFNKEPLREVAAFTDVKFFPHVAVAQADFKKPQFNVTLTNRDGGIGRTVVLVNGKELTADARPRGADANAAKLELQLDLTNDPRLVPGRKNTIEVFAYNAEGYLSSRGLVREFDGPGQAAQDGLKPTLHAVIVGISKYRNEKLNLRYAAKDAEDFATALKLAAGGLFGVDKIQLTILTTNNADARPTRAALEKAFAALAKAKPDDLIVVYLAGHGITQAGQDGDWYYLTADALSTEITDPAVRKQATLSSGELTDFLKASPARKQVLILDTCHSGKVVEKLTEKRDVPGSQIRALERVKDRTGMHVLAGCAADSVSYEASRYGQGILTYSLLLGMRGAKLREGEYVDIVDLFGFAADKVPELARDIGGLQRPTIASPRGSSFDIGRLTAADRNKVPLQSVKPVVLRAGFQWEKQARDSLGLSKFVNSQLQASSSSARGAKLVFVDADEFPGAYLIGGRYKIEGDKVTVNVSLFDGEKELSAFSIDGVTSKPNELAMKIVAEIEARLTAIGAK